MSPISPLGFNVFAIFPISNSWSLLPFSIAIDFHIQQCLLQIIVAHLFLWVTIWWPLVNPWGSQMPPVVRIHNTHGNFFASCQLSFSQFSHPVCSSAPYFCFHPLPSQLSPSQLPYKLGPHFRCSVGKIYFFSPSLQLVLVHNSKSQLGRDYCRLQ